MNILLQTKTILHNSTIAEEYKTKVVDNYYYYIKDLLEDLKIKNHEIFEVFEAETILKDLFENVDIDSLFLKKYFLLREHSIDKDDWYNTIGIALPDYTLEIESMFNLDQKLFTFLNDSFYYIFKSDEFLDFSKKYKISENYNLNFSKIENSQHILIEF
ncbi:hypothetical protein BA768_17110 [Chryseobacterium sp. CBo1]|uniref:hypothetical protein n=1 Tax=Chryseobacterium sp. CBo1 TaxID=1869230 RepID=UPI000810BC2A|nr:hypothetical protein [Chryseobacterium sp. CBo1]OCK51277.1 hypothetical protein BA768_17110 [Chryseobacterium sp. CBo1]